MLHLVTGYKGAAHITATDAGALNAGTFGAGEYVLDVGNKFAASVLSSNTIQILDGDLMMQGRHITLKKGTYEDITIENGTVGMNRNDLIVVRYTKDATSGIENAEFAVIKGEETSGTATDPSYTKGDILSGDCVLHEMPLYRIPLTELVVGTPEPLFKVTGSIENGLKFLGDFDEIRTSDDTLKFWRELGSGYCTVYELESISDVCSGQGIVFNLLEGRRPRQFFIDHNTGRIFRRDSGLSAWNSDWYNPDDNIIVGTYTGDGKSSKLIDLGFQPLAVIVTRSDGSAVRSHWGGENGTYFYGGLATNKKNCMFWDGTNDHPVIELASNGFYVYENSVGTGSAAGYIHTNSESTYSYIAFRRY